MGYISSNIYCLLNWKIIINFWLWKNFSFGQIHFGFLFSVSVEANQNVQHGRVLRTMSTKRSRKSTLLRFNWRWLNTKQLKSPSHTSPFIFHIAVLDMTPKLPGMQVDPPKVHLSWGEPWCAADGTSMDGMTSVSGKHHRVLGFQRTFHDVVRILCSGWWKLRNRSKCASWMHICNAWVHQARRELRDLNCECCNLVSKTYVHLYV